MRGKWVLRRIDKILNEYVAKFDLSARLDSDFIYYYTSDIVTYALAAPDRGGRHFMQFVKQLRPELTAPIFLASLFHEIGHSETLDDLTEEEISYCRDEKKRILSKESYTKKDDFTYFNLPDEKIATEWGLDYMYNHAEEVTLLWHKLQPLIQFFYKLNGIKED